MDDQKLKEMLSAWFDGELSAENSALVEAYLERSEEARQIIKSFKVLKELADKNRLNSKSDYWEESASRIERVINKTEAKIKVTHARSAWNDWGWRAVSLAASVVMLTYVGFHAPEILNRLNDEPEPVIQRESMIQKNAREDRALQNLAGRSNSKEEVDQIELEPRKRSKIKSQIPKPNIESSKQRVVQVPQIEDENKRQRNTDTIKQIGELQPPKKTREQIIAEAKVLRQNALTAVPTAIVDSVDVENELAIPEAVSFALEALDHNIAKPDVNQEVATAEEQYRYLWDHVIVHKLSTLEASSSKKKLARSAIQSLASDLDNKSIQTDKKAKNREKRLIDAAFYVGNSSENSQEKDLALRYLRFMALENVSIIDKTYAEAKWNELKKNR